MTKTTASNPSLVAKKNRTESLASDPLKLLWNLAETSEIWNPSKTLSNQKDGLKPFWNPSETSEGFTPLWDPWNQRRFQTPLKPVCQGGARQEPRHPPARCPETRPRKTANPTRTIHKCMRRHCTQKVVARRSTIRPSQRYYQSSSPGAKVHRIIQCETRIKGLSLKISRLPRMTPGLPHWVYSSANSEPKQWETEWLPRMTPGLPAAIRHQ